MSNLIKAQELNALLGQENLRIIDARFVLNDVDAGQRSYTEGHIPNAIFFDLDKDLSQTPSDHGGRHPLPNMQAFGQKLAERGVGSSSRVVVYDDNSGVLAGRVWWMLKHIGHDAVQLLDGGLSAWTNAGYELSSSVPSFEKTTFNVDLRSDMLVGVDYIKRNLDNPDVLLIDARAAARYRGENEPLDKKAGHIPSALNLPVTDNLQNGKFKSAVELKERFTELGEAEEIIVYCGSGVSANHNIIALEESGIKGAKLYVGSWSDWSSYPDNEVATGDEA